MPDCFNVTYIKRGLRHWLVFPGLLGLADDLALILPQSDSFILIDYKPNAQIDYLDAITSLTRYFQSNFDHLDSLIGVGYSMGGRLLFSLSSAMPTFITGAVYISSGFPLNNPKERFNKYKFNRLALAKLTSCTSIDFLNWWYQLPIYKGLSSHPEFSQMIQKKISHFDPINVTRLLQSFNSLNMPLSSPSSVPSLYLHGEYDPKYQTIATQVANHYLTHLMVISIPNSSHLCYWESPSFLQQSIKKWASESI